MDGDKENSVDDEFIQFLEESQAYRGQAQTYPMER